ncbi:MAG: sulfite exporter TauE/SafE family protein [Proteobacteria bacterium]|nr:sulfite exporter TauE/SafE family protein [Pseudomonadota bacterium]
MPNDLTVGVSFFSVWALGASLGLTACTITCLPFMSSWVIARSGIQRKVLWWDAGLFVSGRIAAYMLLALTAAIIGKTLSDQLSHGIGNLLIALAAFFAAAWLMLDYRRSCNVKDKQGAYPPFWLGFSLSFVPCAPLATLLALSAQVGSAWQGIGYGLSFGLGSALTPLLLVLPLLHKFSQQIRQQHHWLPIVMRWSAALVLVALGTIRFMLWWGQ